MYPRMVLSGLKFPELAGTMPTPAALYFGISPAHEASGTPVNETNAGLNATALSIAAMNVETSASLNGIDLKVHPNVAAAAPTPAAFCEHVELSHVRYTTVFPVGAAFGSGVFANVVGTCRWGFSASFALAASCAGVDLLAADAEEPAPTPRAIANTSAAEIVPSLSFTISPLEYAGADAGNTVIGGADRVRVRPDDEKIRTTLPRTLRRRLLHRRSNGTAQVRRVSPTLPWCGTPCSRCTRGSPRRTPARRAPRASAR